MNTTKLTAAVEEYLSDLRKIRASGGATERALLLPSFNQSAERHWRHAQAQGILRLRSAGRPTSKPIPCSDCQGRR